MQWLRKGLLVWALGISLSTANDQNSQYLIQKKQELIETLEQNTTSPSNWETHKESLEDESLKAIHTDTIANLNSTPFATSGRTRMISPTLGNILGYGQAETIMREQNFYPSPLEFQATQRYDLYETLSYPLIYPELKRKSWSYACCHKGLRREKCSCLLWKWDSKNGNSCLYLTSLSQNNHRSL